MTNINGARRMRCAWALVALACGCMVGVSRAQEAAADKPVVMSRVERADRMMTAPTRTFYLKNAAQTNDANEILTGLRLMLDPSVKIYLVPNQQAIVIRALQDDMGLAAKLIEELDRPRRAYRLTYTVTEMDGTRRVSSQHFTLSMLDGQRTTLKQGSKVPIVTGKYNVTASESETQVTYLDIGMSFDSTVNGVAGGAVLKSKVEQSSIADEKPSQAAPDPVIRQTVLESVSALTLGKTTRLGGMDLPGSTRRQEVEVMLEPAP